MSSIPSRRVRPLHDNGMPEGPKRITRSPNGAAPPLDYYSGAPDINRFARKRSWGSGFRLSRVLPRPATSLGSSSAQTLRGLRARAQMFKSTSPFGVRIEALFMAKPSKTNPHLQRVVQELREVSRKAGVAIWRDDADRLERSRKNWSEVNLSRLSRYASKGEQIVVPGVVLATGEISTPLTVAAFRASSAARKKIEAAGGRAPTPLGRAAPDPE